MDHQETEQQHSEDQRIPAAPAVPARNRYPPGYRFVPTDGELIQEYLQKKINNEPIPIDEISETNLKQVNPWEIQAKFPKLGDEWYFFTPRDRKYPNGERPDRGSDSGYWKATGADKPVKVGDEIVGFKKALVFYQGKPQKGQKTNWIMHEYRVNGAAHKKTSKDDMRLDDWVLCRMYDKSTTTRLVNKRKNANAQEPSDSEVPVPAAQDMAENPGMVPENPYPFNYHLEQNPAHNFYHPEQNPADNFYLEDILKQSQSQFSDQNMINTAYQEVNPMINTLYQEPEPNPSFRDVYFQLGGIMVPPNHELFEFQQQQANNGASSSRWTSNEAASYWRNNEVYVPVVHPNINNNFSPRIFDPIDGLQNMTIDATNFSPPIFDPIDGIQNMTIDVQKNMKRFRR